jgi:hypothetical protein
VIMDEINYVERLDEDKIEHPYAIGHIFEL